MGRGDIQIEPPQCRGQIVEQAGPVEPGHLDHRETARCGVVEHDFRDHHEGLRALARLAPAIDEIGDLHLALERALDRAGNLLGTAQFILVPIKRPRQEDRIERHTIHRGEDLGIDDVAAGGGTGAGDDGEQARMVR